MIYVKIRIFYSIGGDFYQSNIEGMIKRLTFSKSLLRLGLLFEGLQNIPCVRARICRCSLFLPLNVSPQLAPQHATSAFKILTQYFIRGASIKIEILFRICVGNQTLFSECTEFCLVTFFCFSSNSYLKQIEST